MYQPTDFTELSEQLRDPEAQRRLAVRYAGSVYAINALVNEHGPSVETFEDAGVVAPALNDTIADAAPLLSEATAKVASVATQEGLSGADLHRAAVEQAFAEINNVQAA